MLTKIESKEIMTHREAQEKYRDKYFHFLIIEVVDSSGQNDLGYVVYTYDEKRDMRGIPRDEFKGKIVAHAMGWDVEKGFQIGGVTIERKN